MEKIQVTKSSMPEFEEYVEEIRSLWESHWLTNMGEKHKKLESKLKNYLESENVILFSNGHLALEAALNAYELQGEVITSPFTFASTVHAITRNGLTPVFCDINEEDYTIDVKQIERLITKKTTAIVPIHVYGNICDVEELDKLARKYDLKVIYDAAHAFGTKIDGVPVSRFGNASMFSFHATKVFNTIEGGAIVFQNNQGQIASRLNMLKNFGITGPETVEIVGGNAKMNEFQAAMGICNLKYLSEEISKRKKIVERYMENLKNVPGIILNKIPDSVESNYAYFPVRFDNYHLNRDEVFELLLSNEITARKYFYPLANDFECYKEKYSSDDTPIAKKVSKQILTLPLYASLSLDDVDRICKLIVKGEKE
ncbi:DegT/DnrJ/EryC1/StrS family aminotransferase [Vagococcus carniphilus]|uniref:DegT/DnrJ/EryC1/StrS family aminotransferase n=1 Tax=Vagococcus carniphilus TaxID=218144 RepID=A0AAW8U6G1_9ENTE|nr:DegT/DnrJ/EryC1/StrS family aminotransferase [Vagococcus carniphilus]MDT2833541.1 DegT/DnrJ/EryC1/StrS family aminotransferase [Vagococcus carniphilus]